MPIPPIPAVPPLEDVEPVLLDVEPVDELEDDVDVVVSVSSPQAARPAIATSAITPRSIEPLSIFIVKAILLTRRERSEHHFNFIGTRYAYQKQRGCAG